ncbi:MAG: radical SAM protein [Candidatus Omnitrophica bacterium]|nr:radical SAM protein [Candidatus Omnitrophota bacterium]
MEKPKVVLIQPDSPFLSEPLSFPGLGLLYVCAFLKDNGYEVEFYDLTGGLRLPEKLRGDIFGFSCQTVHLPFAASAVKDLRKDNPDSIFIVGGPCPTWSAQDCLERGFDIVVRGEGENSMLDIANNFKNIRDAVKGNREVRRVYTPDCYLDVNNIPFPDWEAVDIKRYRYQLDGRRCMSIITCRGSCPFGIAGNCRFCSKTDLGKVKGLRFRSPENVLREVRTLKERYGFGSVMIYDDEIMINKARDIRVFSGLKEMDIKFRCMTRVNLATKEELIMLKDYGCIEVCIGAESGDPHILEDVIKKGTTVEQNTRFVQWCKEIGLNVKVYLILGLPSESRKSLENTYSWLEKTRPSNYDVSIYAPYPGSEFYDHKEKYEIEWDQEALRKIWYTGEPQYGAPAVWTPYLSSKEIADFRDKINKEFKRGVGGTTSYWGPMPEDAKENN